MYYLIEDISTRTAKITSEDDLGEVCGFDTTDMTLAEINGEVYDFKVVELSECSDVSSDKAQEYAQSRGLELV